MNPSEMMLIALKFNQKINLQDLEGLTELMTEDHTFVNSEGETTKGKNAMKEGWRQFFKKYPDYKNIFTCVTTQKNVVVMIGYSTCSSNHSAAQTCGPPKSAVNVSPNGEYAGSTVSEHARQFSGEGLSVL